jgi:hypothetical protein
VEYLPLILIAFFALYIVVSPLTVWFHELGHAIPAMLASGKEVTIYIGSYGNEKDSFHINWGRMNMWVKPGIRKRGLCIYPDGLSLKMLIISTLCGPLASIIVGVFMYYLIFTLDAHGMVKLVTVVFLISATVDLFVNLFPRKMPLALTGGTTYNDGYIILHLIRYGEMPAFKFTTDEKGHIDPDEADEFLAHYSEVKFDAAFYRHLIIVNIYKNRNNRALELHTLLSQKYSLTADDYGFRSILSMRTEQLSDGLSDAEKAISLEPDNVFAHFALGLFYIENNEKEKALEHLNRAWVQRENIYGYEESLERAKALN